MIGARLTRPARLTVTALGFALMVAPIAANPASAATTASNGQSSPAAPTVTNPSLEGGAFGTYLNLFNLGSPYGTFNFGPKPQVVTPPNGGSVFASLGSVSFGGGPYTPPYISVGPSAVASFGKIISPTYPQVGSSAGDQSVTIRLGSGAGSLTVSVINLGTFCLADDKPNPAAASVRAGTTVLKASINGQSIGSNFPPNTTFVESYPTSTGTGTLTLVFNEQVPGQSTDHFKGILVNGLHVYIGSAGPTYTNLDSAIFAESRCEVAIIPLPPGIIPEAPLALALPISGAAVGGAGLIVVASRRRRRAAARGVAA